MSKKQEMDQPGMENREPDAVDTEAVTVESEAASNDSGANVAQQEAMIFRQIARQRKARIVIPSGRDAHERCPVPVGLNGREFLIERDKEVDVPLGVLEVLNLAQASIAQTSGSDANLNTTFHKAPRFPYRLLGYVNPETGKLEQE